MTIAKLIEQAVKDGHVIEYVDRGRGIQVRSIDGVEYKTKEGNRQLRVLMNDPWGRGGERIVAGGDIND